MKKELLVQPVSILDTDLYKLTMQQAVCQLYPEVGARYQFVNRGKTQFPAGFDKVLKKHIKAMATLGLTKEEKEYIAGIRFFNPVYADFLAGYRFDPREVQITQQGGDLQISIEGPWYRTILWEVPLMALISELYFEMTGQGGIAPNHKINITKAQVFRKILAFIVDFGTRRRYSYANQLEVIADLRAAGEFFRGTSNVHLARILGLPAIGTQAHEWIQFHAAKYGFEMANSTAMGRWVDVYHGDLGIALSDTFGSQDFFRVFDTFYAKLFDGVRQDSGDPIAFGHAAIEHYKKLGIDPKSKVIVFSDGLSPEAVAKIQKEFEGQVKITYGIGTNLTNDVGVKPLNIVIKLVGVKLRQDAEWTNVVKLSDDAGKHTGDPATIELCKRNLGI